jgi:hypothetical protein
VGGLVLYFEYQRMGVTRQEGIADIRKYSNRLWLAEIGPDGQVGPPVELTLQETYDKNLDSPTSD